MPERDIGMPEVVVGSPLVIFRNSYQFSMLCPRHGGRVNFQLAEPPCNAFLVFNTDVLVTKEQNLPVKQGVLKLVHYRI
jgi:hypothetical protein